MGLDGCYQSIFGQFGVNIKFAQEELQEQELVNFTV